MTGVSPERTAAPGSDGLAWHGVWLARQHTLTAMQLYVGSTNEFLKDAIEHRLADVLNDRFYDYYGFRSSPSELQ